MNRKTTTLVVEDDLLDTAPFKTATVDGKQASSEMQVQT